MIEICLPLQQHMQSRSQKRKGDDFMDSLSASSDGMTVAVYSSTSNFKEFSSTGGHDGKDWEDCRKLIQSMFDDYNNDNDDDHFLPEIQELATLPKQIESKHEEYLESQAKTILFTLQQQVEREHERKRKEEKENEEINQKIRQMSEENKVSQEELERYTEREQELEHSIRVLLSEITHNIDDMDKYREICKQNVPKLRQQLSLYASITRIKWYFEKEHTLCGQIDIPSRYEIKTFDLDPNELSRYEIAKALWNMIDGSTEPDITDDNTQPVIDSVSAADKVIDEK